VYRPGILLNTSLRDISLEKFRLFMYCVRHLKMKFPSRKFRPTCNIGRIHEVLRCWGEVFDGVGWFSDEDIYTKWSRFTCPIHLCF
jgi:hypothetical protein